MSVYLFDMGGEPVAFRRTWTDPHLFDLEGYQVGYFAWDDNDVVDLDGHYLGTVVDDRLVRRNDWYERPCAVTPPEPGRIERTGRPPAPHYFPNCFAYQDVKVPHHA